MKQPTSLLIVGGGAAGMMAAIVAARQGCRVTILERMQRVGKKLLATGNGRCNLTNVRCAAEHYHGGQPGFVEAVLTQFDVPATLEFFRKLGIEPRVEEDGKVYPRSGQASSVLEVLRDEMERLQVQVIAEARAQTITPHRNGFECRCTNETSWTADRVILAAGGQAAPNLGSNGTGFKLAQQLGHTLVEPVPALVQVCLDAPFLKHLSGQKVNGVASLWADGVCCGTAGGELLFADYGISGLPILHLSRHVSRPPRPGASMVLRLDLFPEWSEDELAGKIEERIAWAPGKTVEFCFVGLLPKRFIAVLLREAGLTELKRLCGDLDESEIRKLAHTMKDWPLVCAGTKSWMDAQVTAGGVDVSEVDSHTLESKRTPGIYLCGELLDIDGDSGGYNLQWAWSSGYVAALHAAMAKTF